MRWQTPIWTKGEVEWRRTGVQGKRGKLEDRKGGREGEEGKGTRVLPVPR